MFLLVVRGRGAVVLLSLNSNSGGVSAVRDKKRQGCCAKTHHIFHTFSLPSPSHPPPPVHQHARHSSGADLPPPSSSSSSSRCSPEMVRCFRALELEPGSSRDRVRSQYIALAKKFHPDSREGNADRFQRIDSARNFLFYYYLLSYSHCIVCTVLRHHWWEKTETEVLTELTLFLNVLSLIVVQKSDFISGAMSNSPCLSAASVRSITSQSAVRSCRRTTCSCPSSARRPGRRRSPWASLGSTTRSAGARWRTRTTTGTLTSGTRLRSTGNS